MTERTWPHRILVALLTVMPLTLVGGEQARAEVEGPCVAQVDGVDVTTGHETAGTAVHIDYRDDVVYEGRATGGDVVTMVEVTLEVEDVGLVSERTESDGSTWKATASIERYAWAGVGLYLVRGEALAGGDTVCTGRAYVCIDGKSPFLTVAGAGAGVLALLSLIVIGRGLATRSRRSRAGLAWRFGAAGVLGGVGVPVLLQQHCVTPLTNLLGVGSVGGGLVGLALVGALIGARPRAPLPAAARAGLAPPERARREAGVYRFRPTDDACKACRSHAQHRTYRTEQAIEADRPHRGCHCEVILEPGQQAEVVALFAGRGDVIDDRETSPA
jgi:hypothetical protein